MSEEDDDYMSDAVLQACGDSRPGLYKSAKEVHSRKQQLKDYEAKKNAPKPLKVLESEKRVEGLGTRLDSANKGFVLLQKMGYKPGTAVGKHGAGRVEPIGVEVKVNRGGLGQDTENRRRKQEAMQRNAENQQKKIRLGQQMQKSFRAAMSDLQKTKLLQKFVKQSQNACVQLDAKLDLSEPQATYFWPPHAKVQTEDEEEETPEDEPELDVQLQEITDYLRKTHLYCVWCGYSFDDAESLANDCPGDNIAAHDEL